MSEDKEKEPVYIKEAHSKVIDDDVEYVLGWHTLRDRYVLFINTNDHLGLIWIDHLIEGKYLNVAMGHYFKNCLTCSNVSSDRGSPKVFSYFPGEIKLNEEESTEEQRVWEMHSIGWRMEDMPIQYVCEDCREQMHEYGKEITEDHPEKVLLSVL